MPYRNTQGGPGRQQEAPGGPAGRAALRAVQLAAARQACYYAFQLCLRLGDMPSARRWINRAPEPRLRFGRA